jgi:seryl-tRNA synthetase
MDVLQQIMLTIGAVAGSTALWTFLAERIKTKAKLKESEMKNNDGNLYRDDLKNRVSNLEKLLLKATNEKDELNNKVLQLTVPMIITSDYRNKKKNKEVGGAPRIGVASNFLHFDIADRYTTKPKNVLWVY